MTGLSKKLGRYRGCAAYRVGAKLVFKATGVRVLQRGKPEKQPREEAQQAVLAMERAARGKSTADVPVDAIRAASIAAGTMKPLPSTAAHIAAKKGYIRKNPARRAMIADLGKNALTGDALTGEDIRKLLHEAPAPRKGMGLVCLNTCGQRFLQDKHGRYGGGFVK